MPSLNEKITSQSSPLLLDDEPTVGAQVPAHVAMQAVEFYVDLQSHQDTQTTLAAVQEWRGQHPDHERAWQHIETVNGQFKSLHSTTGSAVAHASMTKPGMSSRRDMIKAMSLLLFTGGVGWTAKEHLPWQPYAADYRTAVGEQHKAHLTTGLQVHMNTDTALSFNKGGDLAVIDLVQGEILVNAQASSETSAHPLLSINTVHGQVKFEKAKLSLRQFDNYCRVSILEGTAEVFPFHDHSQSRMAYKNEELTFNALQVDKPKVLNRHSTAWEQGMIVASGMRLDEFLTELSRYRHGRLRCDKNIADLRVSGTYPLANTDNILNALETSLKVKMHYLTRFFITVKSAAV